MDVPTHSHSWSTSHHNNDALEDAQCVFDANVDERVDDLPNDDRDWMDSYNDDVYEGERQKSIDHTTPSAATHMVGDGEPIGARNQPM
ncbi:hypothetical protein V2J09_016803 [Rumex salicifolius]